MPELPEAETIRRQLEKEIIGAKIKKVEVHIPRATRGHSSTAELAFLVEGRQIKRVGRRGKAILLFLNGNKASILIIRLGMTGLIRINPSEEEINKHTAVTLAFSDGRSLRFIDQRQFGSVTARPRHDFENTPEFTAYGPEPFSDAFTPEYLKEAFSRRGADLETVLMNQNIIAGIGKIYADEICFHAGLRPTRAANKLTGPQRQRLWEATREVLTEAIGHRGSSARDETYTDVYGIPGKFQERMYVYQRAGQPCRVCGATIRRTRMTGGRGMHWCPKCQK